MSDIETLPKSHKAEVYVDGASQYSGSITATHSQGVLLTDVASSRSKPEDRRIHLMRGDRADLVFLDLHDEEGHRLVVPVTIAERDDDSFSLDFLDQVSEIAGTVRRLLTSTDKTERRVADTAEVLPAFRERALTQVDKLVHRFLDEAVDHLFDLSGQPSSRDIQDELYESMHILKRNRKDISAAFKETIEKFFEEPIAPQGCHRETEDDVDFSDLGLVDIQEFEDSLLIDRMVRKWQDKFSLPLDALTIRFAEIAHTNPAETRLPVHVRQLCEAYREIVNPLELSAKVVPELYDFFSSRVLAKLNPFYTGLNLFLSDSGILPGIEKEADKSGSLKKLMGKIPKQEAEPPSPDPVEEAAEQAAASDADEPETPDVAAANKGSTPAGRATAGSAMPGQVAAGQAAPGHAFPGQAGSGQPLSGQPGFTGAGAPGAPGDPGAAPTGGAGTGQAGAAPGGGTAAATSDDAVEAAGPGAGYYDATRLYNSVIDALNFRRNNSAPGGGSAGAGAGAPGLAGGTKHIDYGGYGEAGAAPSAGSPASPMMLASALTALQGNLKARSELRQQSSVRQYLLDNQDSIAALQGTEGLTTDSLNQLDLVDNLFGDIAADVDITSDMRPVVNDLQLPLAKLALLEPQFFADHGHPARGVIDKATQLASSSNFPNKPLEKKLSGIVEQIVENYDQDSSVFQGALEELDSLSQQQHKALERNVERVVKTEEGRDKLRKAEIAVEKVINHRIRPDKAPKPIVDLVDKGWRDLLKLTYVKRGPNSKAWKDYVKTLDLLSLWLLEQGNVGDGDVKVERALEAEPMIDMISQQISEALPTQVEHVEVLETLKEVLSGRAELEYVDIPERPRDEQPDPKAVRERVESLPRLRRWVNRVEDLERGNWMTYRDKEGARRRMRLAWINEDKDRFIFVNERGQKVADLSNIELARRMSRGLKPPAPAEELPLVDQSMYRTLEHVQTSLSFDKNHDSLTRLINREKFEEQVGQALKHAKAKHASHALMYIDIDKFGLVNEVYDRTTGDQVLAEFGKLLAQQHGRKVSSARLGEDRFAVLILDRTLEQAIAQAESIRSDIASSAVNIEGDKISFTVSIGVAAILDHNSSAEEIFEHSADAAAEAKQEGGNRVNQYNEDKARAEAYKAEQSAAIKQIEEALDTKNFVLQAQPIARIADPHGEDTVEHYEILMAISQERGELHSPVDFISKAERFGYMTQVDQWVVRQVFEWISSLMDEQKTIPSVAINLSGNSVTDDAFMDYLFEQISEYGVGTNKICFEITETGTISNMVKAADFVNEFKNIGCKFSIDDFGTGLASHSYLRELPVDYVKIDGTFIRNIHSNPKDVAMTKSINDLAHFLGQETIAEFAENDQVIAKLREIGVDYVQGWGVGRPEPLSSLGGKLAPLEK
jgi:diguanylate cyclase (GGDEF)-like protein